MALKVNLKWGKKNDKGKFNVKGKTLKDVKKALDKREEWGKFEWRCTYDYKADSSGALTSVTIKPTWTIDMPKWPGYSKASKGVKASWDAMWKELFKHEVGHRTRFEDDVKKLIAKLKKDKPADVDSFKTIFDAALVTMDETQKKFDKSTNHGQNKIKLDVNAT